MNILVTGGSKGIGDAILEKLISKGYKNIYSFSRNPISKKYRGLVEEILVDLSETAATQSAITNLINRVGSIDVLVNNAGGGKFALTEHMSINDWIYYINLNLTAPFILTKSTISQMKANNFGKIINILSDASFTSFAKAGSYCATKYGLKGFFDCVRLELVGLNVTVTNIYPGRVDTFFNKKKPGDRPISLKPNDIAKQVLYVLEQRESCMIEGIILKSTLE